MNNAAALRLDSQQRDHTAITGHEVTMLQDGLSVRRGQNALLLEWKCSCVFQDIVVNRHMCVGIYADFASVWLQVLTGEATGDTVIGDMCLQKTGEQLTLAFTRAFLDPKTIALSATAESQLERLLQEFLRNR